MYLRFRHANFRRERIRPRMSSTKSSASGVHRKLMLPSNFAMTISVAISPVSLNP
jgi:hypothetical protein